jgi:hypothetical protein
MRLAVERAVRALMASNGGFLVTPIGVRGDGDGRRVA